MLCVFHNDARGIGRPQWNSPFAVVVESVDAFVAIAAVTTSFIDVKLAKETKCLVRRRPSRSLALIYTNTAVIHRKSEGPLSRIVDLASRLEVILCVFSSATFRKSCFLLLGQNPTVFSILCFVSLHVSQKPHLSHVRTSETRRALLIHV